MGGGNTLNDTLENLIASSCIEIRNALLSEYSDCLEVDHSFSDRFNQRMAFLLRHAKVNQCVASILKYVAIFAISFIIVGSTVLTVNANARERLQNWLKSRIENWTVYETEILLTEWNDIEINYKGSNDEYSFELLDKTADTIVVLISRNGNGALLICDVSEHESYILMPEYEYIQTEVNGQKADFYTVQGEHGTNELFWTDAQTGILLNISGNFTMEEMLLIASNLKIQTL